MSWILRLDPVHSMVGRVRWRYTLQAGTPSSPRAIVRAVENMTGVIQAEANPQAHSLRVHFDPSIVQETALRHALLHLAPPQSHALPRPAASPLPALTGMLVSFANLVGNRYLPAPLRLPASLATALPVFVMAGRDLLHEGISSHVLEAAAVGISAQRKDYLAANTTTFMLAVGEYLEESIAHHSDDLLRQLLAPSAVEAWIEQEGAEVLLPLADLQVGHTVVCGTGQVIPVDGTILSGEASVNESSMTGESVPVRKQRGDSVLSGTILEEGRIRIYAEQVGVRTAAARIADYVEQSLAVKSQAQLRASKMADRLVPLVLGLAGVTFLFTREWQRVAAVLQADYSCVLKLATPVAFKSAMYGAGKAGVLVKGATALERLAEADTFVFDKTGTLTSGHLEVTDTLSFDSAFTANDLLCLAASVEEHYFHPMALAVVNAAQGSTCRHFDHSEVEFIVAHGVASLVAGKRIVVGSRHFVEDDEGIAVCEHLDQIDGLYRQGKTLLYIGYDQKLIGVIALRDQVRANSLATIEELRKLGVKRILMLTGDHRVRAAELAQDLQMDSFHAELLPQDKARILQELAAQGAKVAFVGDGVNDAPALSGAHVGIAMQKGADIARLSADIALLEDNIAHVAKAKRIAQCTMGLIADNYKLAVGLNTGILGAAAFGKLSSASSSVLHNGSTITILLNALRARRYAD